MHKFILFLLSICFSGLNLHASVVTDSLLGALDMHIQNREKFIQQKIDRIEHLKDNMIGAEYKNDYDELYFLYDQLHNEYQSFKYDSAFKYVIRLNSIAPLLNNYDQLTHAKIKMGFTLLSSGLFKESLDTLLSIDPEKCTVQKRSEYYTNLARTYYDLADYDNDTYFARIYSRYGNHYLDSALQIMHEDTPAFWLAYGLRKMKSNDLQGSADAFNFLLSSYNITDHQYAIATSSVGHVYTLLGRNNEAIDMLINAAIADIISSTKETVALRNLAVLLQQKGDIDRAYRYIKLALEDATFYNARHRKIEVGAVLPIIEGERLRIVETQKRKLSRFSLVVSVLSVLVLGFSLIIYFQLKRLVGIRKILQETNNNLQEINERLTESNMIKEEYIGYFFNVNSDFIDKIDSYRKNINRKLSARLFDDLADIIKPSDLKKERENMYSNFDKLFLKLFPHFVERFNSFFRKEDHIKLKQDGLLNPELRIFALMRLGITDSEKIARFLGFSVNTIYTYKTKIKHKLKSDRENFDDWIMEIKGF